MFLGINAQITCKIKLCFFKKIQACSFPNRIHIGMLWTHPFCLPNQYFNFMSPLWGFLFAVIKLLGGKGYSVPVALDPKAGGRGQNVLSFFPCSRKLTCVQACVQRNITPALLSVSQESKAFAAEEGPLFYFKMKQNLDGQTGCF